MSDPVLDTIDHVLHDYETSPDAMRWTPEARPEVATPAVDLEAVRRSLAVIGELVTAYSKAITEFAQRLGKTFRRFSHAMAVANLNHMRSRCRICSPMANPVPLAINGTEYHRRRKRRSRK